MISLRKKIQSLILFTLKSFEFQPPDNSNLPTSVNHETTLILEEEPNIHFVPCPPPFSLPIWVPPSDDVKVGKSENQIVDPSIQPPSTFDNLDPIERTWNRSITAWSLE